MKASLVYHSDTCCRFDCLVRHCTCQVEPVVVEVATDFADTVRQAAGFVGDVVGGDLVVEDLRYWEQTENGALLEFVTTRLVAEEE